MPYVIGTDEAGYGPNLGPLVVGATVWQIPAETPLDDDTWKKLRPVFFDPSDKTTLTDKDSVESAPSELGLPELGLPEQGSRSELGLAIADSKLVYKPGGGLRGLELPLLSMWQAITSAPLESESLWDSVTSEFARRLHEEIWWDSTPATWPVDCKEAEIAEWSRAIDARFQASGIKCRQMQAAVIVPTHFNELIDETGNKANLLTEVTLKLIGQLIEGLDGEPVYILCDRHGGRSKYRAALQQAFPDSLIQINQEGRSVSSYRWGRSPEQVECRFMVGGERHLPVAFASMLAKYLRELTMKSFNAFWQTEVPNLKPTAGYPVDAKRFRIDIEPARKRLGLQVEKLWRCR